MPGVLFSFAGLPRNGVTGLDIFPTQKIIGMSPKSPTQSKHKEVSEDSDSDLDVRRGPSKPTVVHSGLVPGNAVKDMLAQSRAARAEELQAGEHHGQAVAPVHRIGGRVVSRDEWQESQLRLDPKFRRLRKRELDEEFEREQAAKLRKGLEQSSERMAKAEEALRIASEPMGRTSVREEVDEEMRRRERWDDPMSRMKAVPAAVASDKPVSRFNPPPNRFNIPAGYRWDGVVRGTDFEQRWFERTNEMTSKKRNEYTYAPISD